MRAAFAHDGRVTEGPVNGAGAKLSTDPLVSRRASAGRRGVHAPVAAGYNAFLYTYEGSAQVGADGTDEAAAASSRRRAVGRRSRARVAPGQGARFLLLAAKPLREPVVQYGPFVMNTREEIEQALDDYRDGRLAA